MTGQRVLAQVLRTQKATALGIAGGMAVAGLFPLRGVVEEARALTGADAAAIFLPDRDRIASPGAELGAEPSLTVPLPQSAPTAGALTVYGRAERPFTAEDRQVLELLAGLIGLTLTRAALDASGPPLRSLPAR